MRTYSSSLAFWIGVATVLLFLLGSTGLVINTLTQDAREEALALANYVPVI